MREAFYLTTYNDAQAVNDPKYSARGKWRHGPFSSYDAAAAYPMTNQEEVHGFTHFEVSKVFVRDSIKIRFVDGDGNGKDDRRNRASGS